MKDNILRGKLLELLKSVYPEGVERKTIISIFFQYHRVDDIASSLEYLIDKEYVIKKEFPHSYLKNENVQWYKLSPKGIDLMDGNINGDPGILIPKG